MPTIGKAFLVGAGPGDPGLITIKGQECIANADVIIYDWLASDQLLESAKSNAELIYVGKMGGKHAMEQIDINALIVKKALQGKTVTRLKGGDPFVFGRGGEEAEELANAGVEFDIVPGITSAVAVPAYAGIPITHRKVASSFGVITGHEDPTKGIDSSINWAGLANSPDTLVFLMGVGNLRQIANRLIDNGRPASTPVALVRSGTGPEQQTLTGTLETIVTQAEEQKFKPPAVIVVGEVVRLRDKLRWFDNRPLFGKKVLVTRSRHQASALSSLLMEKGAEVLEMPTIHIERMPNYDELDKAISNFSNYDWVILTSANGVKMLFERLDALGKDSREFKGLKLCAIGPATAKALQNKGLNPDYVPPKYTAADIVAGFENQNLAEQKFLLPRAEIASEELVEGLLKLGANVHQIATYKTSLASKVNKKIMKNFEAGEVDIVTFTSSSTAKGFVSVMGDNWKMIDKAIVASIGPVTSATAKELGIEVDLEATEHTIPGLVNAIVKKCKCAE